jgi:hypothetical protein
MTSLMSKRKWIWRRTSCDLSYIVSLYEVERIDDCIDMTTQITVPRVIYS